MVRQQHKVKLWTMGEEGSNDTAQNYRKIQFHFRNSLCLLQQVFVPGQSMWDLWWSK
jgi:hypothetical protein